MTESNPSADLSIQDRVIRCVAQVLAKSPSEIMPQSRLIGDLSADSLDLVELMYVLEDEFGLKLDKQDLSLSAQLGLPEAEVHDHEVVTAKALVLLRARYPQAHELLRPGVTRLQLAPLLTAEAIAIGLGKKLATKDEPHAS
jgi:acyl carrier protein